ncbi:MAG: DUF3782 domain-containing protein [Nodosilinea sp.]
MATTADDVWRLLGELVEAQKETDRKFQDTDRKFQDTDRKFQETDRKFQDTDRKFQETERWLREQGRETDRKLKLVTTAIGDLGNRLGEFVEGLVKPAVVRLFQARGISVHEVHPGVEVDRNGERLEIDLLAVDDAAAVLVEVKSKLSQADVDEHLERLGKFKRLMPRYADVRALGAVAAMVVPPEVARYAYRRGLFVLAQTGDSVTILNDERFQPRAW